VFSWQASAFACKAVQPSLSPCCQYHLDSFGNGYSFNISQSTQDRSQNDLGPQYSGENSEKPYLIDNYKYYC